MKYLFLVLLFAKSIVFAQNTTGCKTLPSKTTSAITSNVSSSIKRSSNSLMDNYDVKFYNIDLNATNASTAISGFVQINAVTKIPNFSKIALNLSGSLKVDSVTVNNVKCTYTAPQYLVSDELIINLSTPLATGSLFKAVIYYHGNGSAGASFPAGMLNGAYNSKNFTYTVSEPYYSYLWWPCKQDLVDKADSVYINITTENTNLVAANGILKNTIDLGNGKKRFEWKTIYPIDSYLITFATGPYVEYKTYANPVGATSSILIDNFLYDQSYLTSNKAVIDKTASMIELFSTKFGMYPFSKEKYGHYSAPCNLGALENQTMSMMNKFDFDLVAHELSHQWFGDNVTCGTWNDIWMHEGFAEYSESLANEFLVSKSAGDTKIQAAQTEVLNLSNSKAYATNTTDPFTLFDHTNSYAKGATVLHMLRFELGQDSIFFNMLTAFQKKYAGKTATTDTLVAFVSKYTNKDYTYFFNQWIKGYGNPVYSFSYFQRGDTVYVTSNQSGSSSTGLFKMKLDFKVNYAAGSTVFQVNQVSNKDVFKFYLPGKTVTSINPNPNSWSLMNVNSGATIPLVSGDNFITAFSFSGAVSSKITGTTIDVIVPYGTNLSSLKATFTASSGATIKIGTTTQTSGATVNDFLFTKVYTVMAANGMTQNYTVNVTVAKNSEKMITSFSLNSIAFQTLPSTPTTILNQSINIGLTSTIDNKYFTTDINALKNVTVNFTSSPGSVVKFNNQIITNGSVIDLSMVITKNGAPCGFTLQVIAEDGSTTNYNVSINSFFNRIFYFNSSTPAVIGVLNYNPNYNNLYYPWTLDNSFSKNDSVFLTFPVGTDLKSITPIYSNNSVGPITSGVTKIDLTLPQTYTVLPTGACPTYVQSNLVVIAGFKNYEAKLNTFSFVGQTSTAYINSNYNTNGDPINTIQITFPYGTKTDSLVANFSNSAGSVVKLNGVVQQSGVTVNNFDPTKTYDYVVVSEAGRSVKYTLQVTIAPPAKDITSFSFSNPNVTGSISGTNITVTVPYGTDVTKLTANFSAPNAKSVTVNNVAQTSGVSSLNFSTSQQYVVTGQDNTTKTFTVTVNVTPVSIAKNITAFSFNGLNPVVTGTISGNTITATVPYGTVVNNLVATFTLSIFASAKVSGVTQVSGTTSNDFSTSKVYTITAQDGSTQNYTVTVTIAPPKSTEKAITAFSFNGLNPIVSATISGTNITATVPFGTNVNSLVPTFTISPKATISSGGITQVSGVTSGNFTTSKNYVVTAEDGSSLPYSVTVTVAKNTEKAITAFSFNGLTPIVTATISGTTITATVPNATNIKSLVATFSSSAASTVKVGTTTQASGSTVNDFTNSLTYVVTAEDGSIQNYTVTIQVAKPDAPVASSPSAVCEGQTIPTLTATGTSLKWYSDAGLTNVVSTSSPFVTGKTSAGVYTYYVTQTANGLESLPTTVTLTIKATPAVPPSGGDQTAMEGSSIPPLSVASTNTIIWYSDLALTSTACVCSSLNTGKTLAGTYTYYAVEVSNTNGCVSAPTAVKLIINTPPAAWTVVTPNATSSILYGVATPSKTANWAIGAAGVLVSNTGTTWSTATSGLSSDIYAISFNGTNNGWAVGKSGKILQYNGTTWTAATNNSTTTLYAVCAVDATTAFASGASGRLLKYTGGSWSSVTNSSVSANLNAISFAGTTKGIIVGGSGTIMTYNGTAWSSTTQGTSDLFGVQLLDANTGWAVGATGTILKYNGTIWTSVTSGVTNNLRSVYFTSATNGYAVGDGGTILKYDGTSWTKVVSGTTNNLYSVAFSDANTGWAVGAAGTIVAYKGVTNTVALPTVKPRTICFGDSPTALFATGTKIVWYSDAAATKQIDTGNVLMPVISAVGTYTYYLTQTVNNVKSLPVAVTITIKPKPTAPITSGNISIAHGASLSPFTATGSNIVWYSDVNLTSQVGTGTSYSPSNPSVGSTTYYATQTINACKSDASSVTLTITNSKSNLKAITAFSFAGMNPVVTATVSGLNITATVPYNTNLANLVATFTASNLATVKVGTTSQVSGTTPNDFSKVVTYTVTAEDGTSQNYTVTITLAPAPKSSEKQLTSFSFNGLNPVVTATISGLNITATVPYNTNLVNLVATFTASNLATVKVGTTSQVSGTTPNDFSKVVTYIVTAEDGTSQNYTVTITLAPLPKSSEKQLLTYEIVSPSLKGELIGDTIFIATPRDVSKYGLIARFTLSTKATAFIGNVKQKSDSSSNDYINTLTYKVVAEDTSFKNYYVKFVKTITSFELVAPAVSGKFVNGSFKYSNRIINLVVPNGTDKSKLVAKYTLPNEVKTVRVNGIVQQNAVTINDFSAPVNYEVELSTGVKELYTVIVYSPDQTVQIPDTNFNLTLLNENEIDANGDNIFQLPETAEVKGLILSNKGIANLTGIEGFVNLRFLMCNRNNIKSLDFSSNPKLSFLQAGENSALAQINLSKNILLDTLVLNKCAFENLDLTQNSNITFLRCEENKLTSLDVSNLSKLSYFVCRKNNLSSMDIRKNLKLIYDITKVVSFSGNPNLKVICIDTFHLKYIDNYYKDSTAAWSTTCGLSSENFISAFSFTGLNPVVKASISGLNITATVPYGTNVSALVATFTASNLATVSVGQIVQVSGTTANNFTNAVTYTVTAEDGTTQNYVVTVTIAPAPKSSAKQITAFSFNGLNPVVTATVSGTNITATVPYGTNVAALVATFTASNLATVSVGQIVQVSGTTANNFTNAVTYIVTAEDGTTQNYVVSVIITPASSAKSLTVFAIKTPAVTATIAGNKITATVPYGTNISSLIATYTGSSKAYVRVGNVIQKSGTTTNNFTNPVTYTVVAQDGSTQDYIVTINIAAASAAKDFISFGIVNPLSSGTITTNNVSVITPATTNLTALIASFTITSKTIVKVNGVLQTSGITSNDFTNPVVYTLTAEDGTSKSYTVTVTNFQITTVNSVTTTTNNSNTPSVSSLVVKPTKPIDITNATLEFNTDKNIQVYVNDVLQVSGKTTNNFQKPVIYTLIDELGNKKQIEISIQQENQFAGLIGLENKTINIYPNPTNDVFFVTSESGDFELQITDIQGREVYYYSSKFTTNEKISIDVKDLPTSIYFVKTILNKIEKITKLEVRH